MLDNNAVSVLASEIRAAFENAIPPEVPMNIRNNISATYIPMCDAIATAIKEFVTKASINVRVDAQKYYNLANNYMTMGDDLEVIGMDGGQLGRAHLHGQNIQSTININNTAETILPGTIS
ncbi:MAG: hypothetical protein Q8M92_09215 [Candidatus Subteraquimicrobiales bacterium]|nr:hypothetical protein [Candidatus Subteraquimicrobiales bacterium]